MNVWPEIAFGDLVRDETGGNVKTLQSDYLPSGAYPIVDQGQDLIGGYTNDEGRVCKSELPVIVFGDHTKCFKFIDFPFCLGADGTKVLRPKKTVDERYLFYALQRLHIPEAGYSRHFKYLKDGKISLPPLDEQKRIAAILDQADELRRKRQHAIDRLNQLGQAIFHEMFGDQCSTIKVSEYLSDIQSGKNLVGVDDDQDSGFRVLKISAVSRAGFRPSETKPLPANYQPPKEHLVENGDLIFSRANTTELVGIPCIVEGVKSNVALPDKLWRLVPSPSKSDKHFLNFALRAPSARRQIERMCSGTSGSMQNISMQKFNSIDLPAVPLSEQQDFATKVLRVSAIRQKVEDDYKAINSLFASLQHRAFQGGL